MSHQRVLVLYNEPVLPESHPDYVAEVEVLDNVEAVGQVLREAGFEVVTLGVSSGADELLDGIRKWSPDAVVNLFEGTADNNASEMYAAGVLEWLGIPYTGCPFQTLVLARSKHLAKRLFLAEGLPTAPFLVVEQAPLPECPLPFPVILKPAQQDASIGVDQSSVVCDLKTLNERLQYMIEQFGGPILVEEFISGREVTVGLVEMPDLRVLPGTEVVFSETRPDYWPILTYDAKWTMGSREFETTDYDFSATFSGDLATQIDNYSRRAFHLLGCRDYARVDFRIRNDKAYILEVNPNPDFAPDRGLSNNLWAAGLSHAEFTVQIVRNALARGRSQVAVRYRDRRAG